MITSAADSARLAQGFELARMGGDAAVFIAIQADSFFERASRRSANVAVGYAQFRQELLAHTLAFGKPAILIHGDTETTASIIR